MLIILFNALAELGMFGFGSLATGLASLWIGMMDDGEHGFKEHTCVFIGAALWVVAWLGGMFYVNGRGIVW